MVALARVVLLVAESSNKPAPDSWSEGSRVGTLVGATDRPAEENGIEHGDVMQALSGAHLREVGITIKEARPGWQEAHVQVHARRRGVGGMGGGGWRGVLHGDVLCRCTMLFEFFFFPFNFSIFHRDTRELVLRGTIVDVHTNTHVFPYFY